MELIEHTLRNQDFLEKGKVSHCRNQRFSCRLLPRNMQHIDELEKWGAYYIYRLYDIDQKLIYIGCSRDPRGRIKQHQYHKSWADKIGFFEIELSSYSKTETRREEARLIEELHPPYNKVIIDPLNVGHQVRDGIELPDRMVIRKLGTT